MEINNKVFLKNRYLKINPLLNNSGLKEELTEYIRKYFELNYNNNATYQNLGDAAKASNRGKVRVLNVYIRKDERNKINHQSFNLRQLDKSKVNPKYIEGRK